MNAIEMKFGRVPHGLENPRQAAGFKNRTGLGWFVKAPLPCLRLIPGDLLSACPYRQFLTLPGLLDSRTARSDSYPNALRAMLGCSLYHFYDGICYDPTGRRTHDLPCETRTRLPLSQPTRYPVRKPMQDLPHGGEQPFWYQKYNCNPR